MIVYKATNKVNGKSYIGQTIRRLEQRKQRHINDALSKRNGTYIGRALKKYGVENFKWKVLHKCNNIEDLNKLEIYYIGLYNTFKNGYNLTLGGNGMSGCKPSEETKQKMSKNHYDNSGENHPQYGKRGKDCHMFGTKASKETRLKLSEMRKGKKNPNYGKERSKETKRKIAATKKGRGSGKNNPAARAVIIKDKYFSTVIEAAKFLNVCPNTIRNRIKNNNFVGYQYKQ